MTQIIDNMKMNLSDIKKEYPPFDISILKTGYSILYKGGKDLFSKAIIRYQLDAGFPPELSEYVHVDVLGPGPWAIRIMPPKAKVVDIRKIYGGKEAIMLKFDAEDFDKNRDKVAWWSVTNNNKPYDWLGVAKFRLPFLFHKKDLPFCSENNIESLRRIYPNDDRLNKPYKIPPAGLFNLCRIVWKGIIPV